MQILKITLFALVAFFGAASSAPFDSIPATNTKTRGLTMKVVGYDGSTNGEMTVVVKNSKGKRVLFDPSGLYFVPQMDPEKAPQRLGAAGPYEIFVDGKWVAYQKPTLIPAKGIRKVRLQLFCLDSHRSSPNSSTPFRLSKKRLSKKLRQTLKAETKKARAGGGHYKSAPVKSRQQNVIWENRDKEWEELEGERKDEKKRYNKGSNPRRGPIRHEIQRRPQIQQRNQ